MTQAAVTRNSSLPCAADFTTSAYQGLADSRMAALGLLMRSATCDRACCARRGCAASVKSVPNSTSLNCRLNVGMSHNKNGISRKASVRTRIATSHFLAIAALAGEAGVSAEFWAMVIGRQFANTFMHQMTGYRN